MEEQYGVGSYLYETADKEDCMKKFAYVENHIIVSLVDQLPDQWKNISGLNKSVNDLNFLYKIGWYPVIHDSVILMDGQTIQGYNYEIDGQRVIGRPILNLLTEADLSVAKRENFMQTLRSIRNQKLMESDFTQLIDVQLLLSDVKKNLWKDYRQALRDLPQNYINISNLNLDQIIWPIKPE